MDTRPIGILDSGVGGLTVWKEIITLLPNESTVYIGDSKHAPYGDRTPEEIYQLASKLIRLLQKKHVKLIVIACNVITTTCIDRLRSEFKDIPLVGTVPVVKKAAQMTRKKRIGILSTNGTANSYYQKHLIDQFAANVFVVNRGTKRLVPLVEEGQFVGEKVTAALKKDLEPFIQEKVDVIALGCTHFPFLRRQMQDILGKRVLLLDSGGAVARQVERILTKNKHLTSKKKAAHQVFTTGKKEILEAILQGITPKTVMIALSVVQ